MYKDTVKFLESNNNMKVYITCISNTLVKFEFDENNRPSNDILLSGFEVLNENTFENQSDDYYHGYTTLYRDIDENTVILSNDGSVYVEPEQPEPYVPTEEELAQQEKQSQIQSLKSQINELKAQLANTDYIFIKCYEANLVGETIDQYDFEALHNERQSLREQINELETELNALETE